MTEKSKFIGIDFDGTMVKYKYPEIGEAVPDALEVCEELVEAGHKLILYTMRSGDRLIQAREYFERAGIELFGVNENPTQLAWTQSKKVFCHFYIDDAAIGCPLVVPEVGRPYADWEEIRDLLEDQGLL